MSLQYRRFEDVASAAAPRCTPPPRRRWPRPRSPRSPIGRLATATSSMPSRGRRARVVGRHGRSSPPSRHRRRRLADRPVAPLVGMTLVSVVVARRSVRTHPARSRCSARSSRYLAMSDWPRNPHHVLHEPGRVERSPCTAREPGDRAAARLHRRRAPPPRSSPSHATSCSRDLGRVLLLGIGYLPVRLGRGFIAAIARPASAMRPTPRWARPHAVLIVVAVLLTFLIGVDGALIGIAAASVVSYAAAAVWAFPLRAGRGGESAGRRRRLREAMTFGSKAWGATLLQRINYRLDLFLSPPTSRARTSAVLRGPVGDRAGLGAARPALSTVISAHGRPARGARPRQIAARSPTPRRRARRGTPCCCSRRRRSWSSSWSWWPCRCCRNRVPPRRCVVRPHPHPRRRRALLRKSLSADVTGRGRPHYALLTTLFTMPLTVALYLLLIPPLGPARRRAGVDGVVPDRDRAGAGLVPAHPRIPLRAALVPSRAELRRLPRGAGQRPPAP